MKTDKGFRDWTPESAEQVRNNLRDFLALQAKQTKPKLPFFLFGFAIKKALLTNHPTNPTLSRLKRNDYGNHQQRNRIFY
ncbi:MAG: hypothetical protein KTR16_02395 [Acidiferrobacterales bacterium]|nr:hypothetical protein [Acidiferrobacterales bacterium]